MIERCRRPYADWTTDALIEYEQRLYDDECDGDDTWFDRDQVLWELNYRDFGEPTLVARASNPRTNGPTT